MSTAQDTRLFEFLSFEPARIIEQLRLVAPPLRKPSVVFRQLMWVVQCAEQLGCRSMILEQRYIDRDHIEDHRVFYSKSRHPYPNDCQRLHFLAVPPEEAQARVRALLEVGIARGLGEFRAGCQDFSDKVYLGFSVIRPLHGTPVGRTVLLYRDPEDVVSRVNVRAYTVHIAGLELEVHGLAFQQQDVGVSACATTAIWSALQRFHKHTNISAITPAHITSLAAKHSLSGRLMPSEGLNLEQMCFALDSLGVTPHLFSVEKRPLVARSILDAAIKSNTTPILLLQKKSADGETAHAVTVVGGHYARRHSVTAIRGADGVPLGDDLSADLQALVVHDDRFGPYIRSELSVGNDGPQIDLPYEKQPQRPTSWPLTHVLVPTHPKVRLSLTDLQSVAAHGLSIVNGTLRYQPSKEHPLGFTEK
jgi:hypothetical protein